MKVSCTTVAVSAGNWRYTLSLEAAQDSLKSVLLVDYLPEPPNPRQRSDDSENRFQVNGLTRTSFSGVAKVHLKAGKVDRLDFDVTVPRESPSQQARGKIYLCHSAADTPLTYRLGRYLEQYGYRVTASNDIVAFPGWAVSLRRDLKEGTFFVAVISHVTERHMDDEIQIARNAGKEIKVLAVGKNLTLPERLNQEERFVLEGGNERQIEAAAKNLSMALAQTA